MVDNMGRGIGKQDLGHTMIKCIPVRINVCEQNIENEDDY